MNNETNTAVMNGGTLNTDVRAESVSTTASDCCAEDYGLSAVVDDGVPESGRVNQLFRAFQAEVLERSASTPPYQRCGDFPRSHPTTWTHANWKEAFWEDYVHRLEQIEEAKDQLPAQARELCRDRGYEDERDARAVLRALRLGA